MLIYGWNTGQYFTYLRIARYNPVTDAWTVPSNPGGSSFGSSPTYSVWTGDTGDPAMRLDHRPDVGLLADAFGEHAFGVVRLANLSAREGGFAVVQSRLEPCFDRAALESLPTPEVKHVFDPLAIASERDHAEHEGLRQPGGEHLQGDQGDLVGHNPPLTSKVPARISLILSFALADMSTS
jgi:hypothetical protein